MSTAHRPERLDFDALIDRHDAILFDAYGVLVNAEGALPGAADAVELLTRRGQPFLVVTNDASRSPERSAQRYQRLGLGIRSEQVLSSGMLITPAIEALHLDEPRVVVIGTDDSADYARAAGGLVIEPSADELADAVVLADEGGFDTLGQLDEVLSMILAGHAQGQTPALFLANPDLIYPSGRGPHGLTFGFTAGSLAKMLERALTLILGDDAPRFDVLGKPAARHFETALTMVGTRNAVMLGDTLHTDVAGARGVGIASGIVLTGITTTAQAETAGAHAPDYLLDSLVRP